MQLFQTNIFFQFVVSHLGNSPMATECRIDMILIIQHLLVLPMLHTKFQLKQFWRKVENRFQDGRHNGHIEYKIDTILTSTHLLIAPMSCTKFQLNRLSRSGEKSKFDFQYGCHVGHIEYRIDKILTMLQMPRTKF